MMFLVIDLLNSKTEEQNKEIERAKSRLINLTICDICFLDQFTCDYESNIYKIPDHTQYPELIKQYLLKIPIVGQQSHDRYIKELGTNVTRYSLAYTKGIVVRRDTENMFLIKHTKKIKTF